MGAEEEAEAEAVAVVLMLQQNRDERTQRRGWARDGGEGEEAGAKGRSRRQEPKAGAEGRRGGLRRRRWEQWQGVCRQRRHVCWESERKGARGGGGHMWVIPDYQAEGSGFEWGSLPSLRI